MQEAGTRSPFADPPAGTVRSEAEIKAEDAGTALHGWWNASRTAPAAAGPPIQLKVRKPCYTRRSILRRHRAAAAVQRPATVTGRAPAPSRDPPIDAAGT